MAKSSSGERSRAPAAPEGGEATNRELRVSATSVSELREGEKRPNRELRRPTASRSVPGDERQRVARGGTDRIGRSDGRSCRRRPKAGGSEGELRVLGGANVRR